MTTENNAQDTGAADAGTSSEGAADTTLMNQGGEEQNNDPQANEQQGDAKGSADDDKSQQQSSESDGEGQDDQQDQKPTEYEEFTMPEGMEVSEEAMGEFKGMLSEIENDLGKALPQETAQKFVDMGASLVQQGVEQAMAYAADYHAKRTQEWIDAFKSDPDLGGTEEQQGKTLATAKTVAKALGGDALLQAINETGAGNHPEVIRAFHKLAGIVGEDGQVVIANQGGGTATLAQRLYPNQQ